MIKGHLEQKRIHINNAEQPVIPRLFCLFLIQIHGFSQRYVIVTLPFF